MLGIIDRIKLNKRKPKNSYGVILGYDGESYFFKLNDLPLEEGMEVSYRGGHNEQGYYAYEVEKLDK